MQGNIMPSTTARDCGCTPCKARASKGLSCARYLPLDEIRTKIQEYSRVILDAYAFLREADRVYADKITSTWKAKDKQKRRDFLKAIQGNISEDHHPEFDYLRQPASYPNGDLSSLQNAFDHPILNIQDLSYAETLPAMILSRARAHPSRFIHRDLDTSFSIEDHPDIDKELEGWTMLFFGQDTMESYGMLVENAEPAHLGLKPSCALPALKVQHSRMDFVERCCRSLIQECIPDGEIELEALKRMPRCDEEVLLPSPNESGWPSVKNILRNLAYSAPGNFDLRDASPLVTKRALAAEDHFEALFADPAYLIVQLDEMREHLMFDPPHWGKFGRIHARGRKKCRKESSLARFDHPKKGKFMGHYRFNGEVTALTVGAAVQSVLSWKSVAKRVRELEEIPEHWEPSSDMRLPHSAEDMVRDLKRVLERTYDYPGLLINRGVLASASTRKDYNTKHALERLQRIPTEDDKPPPYDLNIETFDLKDSARPAMRQVHVMFKELQCESFTESLHDEQSTAEAMQQMLDAKGDASKLVSPFLRKQFSEKGTTATILTLIDSFTPWSCAWRGNHDDTNTEKNVGPDTSSEQKVHPVDEPFETLRDAIQTYCIENPLIQDPHKPTEPEIDYPDLDTDTDSPDVRRKRMRAEKIIDNFFDGLFEAMVDAMKGMSAADGEKDEGKDEEMDEEMDEGTVEVVTPRAGKDHALVKQLKDLVVRWGLPKRTEKWSGPRATSNDSSMDDSPGPASPGKRMFDGTIKHEPDRPLSGRNFLQDFITKAKSRPSADAGDAAIAVNQPEQQEGAVDVAANPPLEINLDDREYNAMDFFFRMTGQQPGELPWTDFMRAMGQIGFASRQGVGAAYEFEWSGNEPPKVVGDRRSINIHGTHPNPNISKGEGQIIRRRLNRAFGWEAETFKRNA